MSRMLFSVHLFSSETRWKSLMATATARKAKLAPYIIYTQV